MIELKTSSAVSFNCGAWLCYGELFCSSIALRRNVGNNVLSTRATMRFFQVLQTTLLRSVLTRQYNCLLVMSALLLRRQRKLSLVRVSRPAERDPL